MTDSMTVSELNQYTRNLLENDILLGMVSVSGEISNFKRHSSGHIYFTLKDEKSKINCSFFRNYNISLKFEPEDGMQVTVSATATVYERDGSYQLLVYKMAEQGQGRLAEKFEALKKKLSEEGLFSEEHKKPIPEFPKRIAVLASPTGAAVRDIISVTGRRAKNTEIVIVPVPVQGEGAAAQIAKALTYADNNLEADTIIIARGGGSIEELWAFNEEVLARAVYRCNTPVISGVGHEVDFTICDFAADMRAATPSAAAEIAVRDCTDVKSDIDYMMRIIKASVEKSLDSARSKAGMIMESAAIRSSLHNISMARQTADHVFDMTEQRILQQIALFRNKNENITAGLKAMDPFSVLNRGFAIASLNGRTLTDSSDAVPGDIINVRLANGELICTVDKTK